MTRVYPATYIYSTEEHTMPKFENRAWVKTVRDDKWKRYDIAPPRKESTHGSWIGITLIIAALAGFMAYGMVKGDAKADPVAAETWVVGDE